MRCQLYLCKKINIGKNFKVTAHVEKLPAKPEKSSFGSKAAGLLQRCSCVQSLCINVLQEQLALNECLKDGSGL